MQGMRCLECGEVRWSILGIAREENEEHECPACGAVMVEERRYPGRRRDRFSPHERRDVAVPRASG